MTPDVTLAVLYALGLVLGTLMLGRGLLSACTGEARDAPPSAVPLVASLGFCIACFAFSIRTPVPALLSLMEQALQVWPPWLAPDLRALVTDPVNADLPDRIEGLLPLAVWSLGYAGFAFAAMVGAGVTRRVAPGFERWTMLPGLARPAALTALILCMILVVAPVVVLNALGPEQTVFFIRTPWIGVFAVLVALADTVWERRQVDAPEMVAEGETVAPKSRLRDLIRDLVARYGRHILMIDPSRALAPSTESTSLGPRATGLEKRIDRILRETYDIDATAAATAARAVRGVSDRTASIVIEETLTRAHLAVVAELCRNEQDNGQLTLIVCPEVDCDQFEKALLNHYDSNLEALGYEGVRFDGQMSLRPSALPAFLTVSEKDFEAYALTQFDTLPEWSRTIGAIVLVNAQDMDLSRLQIGFRQLWTRIDEETVGAVCLTSGVRGAKDLASLVMSDRRKAVFEPLSLGDSNDTERTVIVWRDDSDLGREVAGTPEFARHVSPAIDTLAGLQLHVWSKEFATCLMDPEGLIDRTAVENLERSLTGGALGTVRRFADGSASTLGSYYAEDRAADREGIDVVFSNEDGDLITTMTRSFLVDRPGNTLVNIVSRDWPLRDYVLEAMLALGKNSNILQSDVTPMAPRPDGGLQEVLYRLLSALRREPMTADEIHAGYIGRLPAQVLATLDASPRRKGLEKLFEDLIGERMDIESVDGTEGLRRYTAPHGASRPPFTVPAGTDRMDPYTSLPRADIGTKYLSGRTILIDQDRFLVGRVSEEFVQLAPNSTATPDQAWPELLYEFGSVELQRKGGALFIVAASLPTITDSVRIAAKQAYVTFHRRTLGYYQHDAEEPPFVDGAAPTRSTGEVFATTRNHQRALFLRFTTAEPVVTPEFALTAALLAQDCARALFPRQRSRIRVIAPQASAMQKRMSDAPGEHAPGDVFAARSVARLQDPENRAVFAINDGEDGSGGGSGSGDGDRTILDLVLIEDSDHDLGIVKALAVNSSSLLTMMCGFAAWCAGREDETYYATAMNVSPGFLDFRGVHDALFPNNIRRSVPPTRALSDGALPEDAP